MPARREIAAGLVGLGVGLAAGWLLWSGELVGVEWPEVALAPAEPILVVVVGSRENAASVRGAVSPDRVVASSAEGFALTPRRLIVASLENAGALLMEAGWRDEPLEIVDLQRSLAGDGGASPRLDRVAELMSKPRLTLAEARLALGTL